MNFKAEEDTYFKKIVGLNNSIQEVKDKTDEDEVNRQIGVAAGTNLWLISNEADIKTLDDFRSKLDSFTRVLSNPLYIEMEGNLCVSSVISGYLAGVKTEKEFREVMDLFGYSNDLGKDELEAISRDRYRKAGVCFEELSLDKEVQKDAKNCGFAMNFKFTGDYSEAETLYVSVSSFCDVSEELEEIYRKKRLQQETDKDKAEKNTILK